MMENVLTDERRRIMVAAYRELSALTTAITEAIEEADTKVARGMVFICASDKEEYGRHIVREAVNNYFELGG